MHLHSLCTVHLFVEGCLMWDGFAFKSKDKVIASKLNKVIYMRFCTNVRPLLHRAVISNENVNLIDRWPKLKTVSLEIPWMKMYVVWKKYRWKRTYKNLKYRKYNTKKIMGYIRQDIFYFILLHVTIVNWAFFHIHSSLQSQI